MSGLRVLEAITPSRIGGAEVFVATFCEELIRLGAEVRLFCPLGRPFAGYARERGLKPITWKTRGKLDPITIVRLARLTRRERIDVVHTHLSTASLLGAFAAKLARAPSVAHVHGLNTATCFRYSTRVIAVSEAVKQHLCAQGLDAKRVRVIHNGVDLSRFQPVPVADAKLALERNPSAPLIGVFGRLSEEKGQRVALEAMFILLKDHPTARLVLVGEGKSEADLRTSAAALGIGDSVEFAGFMPDVRPLMSACDAVIVPSLKEGFGLAAVEAMALGRPVVASAVGGLTEIVAPGETGFLADPNDPNAVAQALGELISNPTLAQEMGERGRERAERCFEFDKQAREVLRELEAAR